LRFFVLMKDAMILIRQRFQKIYPPINAGFYLKGNRSSTALTI